MDFVRWYNQEHRHSALRYVTPAERHAGQDQTLLAQRHQVYQAARAQHPRRWSGVQKNQIKPKAQILSLATPEFSKSLKNELAC